MRVSVEDAAVIVREGGVIACPTEAVFGLSCQPTNPDAVARILSLKQRLQSKGLILIASDFSQLKPFCTRPKALLWNEVQATWPGPHTWLFPASATCPTQIRGAHSSIAIRITAHPVASHLCHLSGSALVSTSANISGNVPARSTTEVMDMFGDTIDAVIEGEIGNSPSVTPIKDAITGESVRS